MPTRYRERIVERSNGRLIATVDRAVENRSAMPCSVETPVRARRFCHIRQLTRAEGWPDHGGGCDKLTRRAKFRFRRLPRSFLRDNETQTSGKSCRETEDVYLNF